MGDGWNLFRQPINSIPESCPFFSPPASCTMH
jgi:hypothetical protein